MEPATQRACRRRSSRRSQLRRSGSPRLRDFAAQAPDSFTATFETSAGDFEVEFYREWAPAGVDRVYHLTRYNFYAGSRFFRVNPALVQFGLTGQPALDSVWADLTIPDDLLVASNARGRSRSPRLARHAQHPVVHQSAGQPPLRYMLRRWLPAGREGGERNGDRRCPLRRPRRDAGHVPGLDHDPRQRVPGPAVSRARYDHQDAGQRARGVAGTPEAASGYPISSSAPSHSTIRSATSR